MRKRLLAALAAPAALLALSVGGAPAFAGDHHSPPPDDEKCYAADTEEARYDVTKTETTDWLREAPAGDGWTVSDEKTIPAVGEPTIDNPDYVEGVDEQTVATGYVKYTWSGKRHEEPSSPPPGSGWHEVGQTNDVKGSTPDTIIHKGHGNGSWFYYATQYTTIPAVPAQGEPTIDNPDYVEAVQEYRYTRTLTKTEVSEVSDGWTVTNEYTVTVPGEEVPCPDDGSTPGDGDGDQVEEFAPSSPTCDLINAIKSSDRKEAVVGDVTYVFGDPEQETLMVFPNNPEVTTLVATPGVWERIGADNTGLVTSGELPDCDGTNPGDDGDDDQGDLVDFTPPAPTCEFVEGLTPNEFVTADNGGYTYLPGGSHYPSLIVFKAAQGVNPVPGNGWNHPSPNATNELQIEFTLDCSDDGDDGDDSGSQPEVVKVVPTNPEVDHPQCVNGGVTEGSITPASTEGVDYVVEGNLVYATPAEPTDDEFIYAWGDMPEAWELGEGGAAVFTVQFDEVDNCQVPPQVVPESSLVNPLRGVPACSDFPTPGVAGVHYDTTSTQDGDILTVVVTASPLDGFTFDGEQSRTWTKSFDTSQCSVDNADGDNQDDTDDVDQGNTNGGDSNGDDQDDSTRADTDQKATTVAELPHTGASFNWELVALSGAALIAGAAFVLIAWSRRRRASQV